jgi:hypothetical protein
MAARIPSCRCVAFATGHEIHSTLPDEFTRVLIGFPGRVRQ